MLNAARVPAAYQFIQESDLKKLFIYFEHYKKETVLAPLFKLLEACMDLIVPLIVASIINRGIAAADTGYIISRFALLILLAALGLAFSFTAQWFAARASVGVATDIRQALFDHIQTLSCRELDRIGTDTLITRMTSDINQVQNGINLALRLLLRSPFIVFGAMIMAFTIDVRCALIFACAIPLLSAVVFGIMILSIPLFRKAQALLDRLLGSARENLTGVRVIRAFCREDSAVAEFDERNEALTGMNEFVGRLSALMNPATYVIINIAAIFLIHQGAVNVNLGTLRQGDVVALYNYMAQITVELIKLASLIITINKSLACADRVQTVFGEVSSLLYGGTSSVSDLNKARDLTAREPAVRFSDVSFSYENAGEEAIRGISFSALPGQTIGIIGGTGSGKTTLANLIPRFYDATSGTVELNGTDIREYSEDELLRMISVVPQKAILFQGSVRDNLRLGNETASDDELWNALRIAQAEDVVKEKDGQLDALIEQNGRNLSGGQRQRLTIARALVKKPEILILDDSSSALDFATDLRLRRAIHNLARSMTVFIISQRTSSIKDSDLILVLDDGALAGKGSHLQLMENCPVYQEIFYSQFPEQRSERKKGSQ